MHACFHCSELGPPNFTVNKVSYSRSAHRSAARSKSARAQMPVFKEMNQSRYGDHLTSQSGRHSDTLHNTSVSSHAVPPRLRSVSNALRVCSQSCRSYKKSISHEGICGGARTYTWVDPDLHAICMLRANLQVNPVPPLLLHHSRGYREICLVFRTGLISFKQWQDGAQSVETDLALFRGSRRL